MYNAGDIVQNNMEQTIIPRKTRQQNHNIKERIGDVQLEGTDSSKHRNLWNIMHRCHSGSNEPNLLLQISTAVKCNINASVILLQTHHIE